MYQPAAGPSVANRVYVQEDSITYPVGGGRLSNDSVTESASKLPSPCCDGAANPMPMTHDRSDPALRRRADRAGSGPLLTYYDLASG